MRIELLAATCLVLAVLTGCSTDDHTRAKQSLTTSSGATSSSERSSPSPATRSAFDRFVQTGEDWEIEHFDSLDQLVERSDLAVVGTVTGGHWGHEYRDAEADSPDDVELYRDVVYEIHVDQTISGEAVGPEPGVIELVIDMVDPREEKLDPPVGEQAVFFLRRIGGPIPGVDPSSDPHLLAEKDYRQVSSLGVLDLDKGKLAFPLGGGAPWATHLLTLSWDDAVAKLVSLARD